MRYEVTGDKRSRDIRLHSVHFVEVQTKLATYMYMCCGSNLILGLNFFKPGLNFSNC